MYLCMYVRMCQSRCAFTVTVTVTKSLFRQRQVNQKTNFTSPLWRPVESPWRLGLWGNLAVVSAFPKRWVETLN